jgi:hypothetical protein
MAGTAVGDPALDKANVVSQNQANNVSLMVEEEAP